MAPDLQARAFRDSSVDIIIHGFVDIDYGTAAIAAEMIVRRGAAVVPADPSTFLVRPDLASLAQQSQVAIDRPQAYFGNDAFHLGIDPLSSGMLVGAAYHTQDRFTLS
jgi:hypothetical protein